MKKYLVNVKFKDSLSFLVDVESLEDLKKEKQQARKEALNQLRKSFDSDYYKALLRNNSTVHDFEVINVPEIMNK